MKLIENFAKKNNIIAGVCHAAPLDATRLSSSPFVPFVSSDIVKRTNPQATLSAAQSIVVIGAGYSPQGKTIPNLSSLGVNDDYHIIVKNLLTQLAELLLAEKYKILVDSPGLDERALAVRAGLGFFGRNGLVISKKFGSRFNIGCLLTNLPLPEAFRNTTQNSYEKNIDIPVEKQGCPADCKLCIKSCPTGALQPAGFDARRCISYLTQKNSLSSDEEKLLHGQLYGCDICQNICPFNSPINETAPVNPQKWLNMDDAAFSKKYGHTAMLWKGAEILRRNAMLVATRPNGDSVPAPMQGTSPLIPISD